MQTQTLPPPVAISLVVCQKIIVDQFTQQASLIGAFLQMEAPGFPITIPEMWVYFEFTNARGNVALTIKLVDAGLTRPPIFEAHGSVGATDPLMIAHCIMSLENVTLPQRGDYRFQVWSGSSLLIERRLNVTPARQRPMP